MNLEKELILRLENYAQALAVIDELHALFKFLQRKNMACNSINVETLCEKVQALAPMLTLVSTRTNNADLTHSDWVHVDARRLCRKTSDTDATILSNHLYCLLYNRKVTSCIQDDLDRKSVV